MFSFLQESVFLQVDRLFEWKRGPNSSIIDTIKKQKRNTKQEFEERVQITINEFAEQVGCHVLLNWQTSNLSSNPHTNHVSHNYTLQFSIEQVSQRRYETCSKVIVAAVYELRSWLVQRSSFSFQRYHSVYCLQQNKSS